MIRFKDIQIPKPCSVAYDSLPGDTTKRFCSSCKEHVYDFRGKDETYLNQTFTTHGQVCGVYYADLIQQPSLQKQRPLYYAFATKMISIGLFLKTLLSSNQAEASTSPGPPLNQYEQRDSIAAIKAQFKNKPEKYNSYYISIFINNILYKKNISVYDGYLYMPDNLSGNDSIKVLVHKKRALRSRRVSYSIKPKEYLFKFEDADKIIVEINYKFHFNLIKRREIRGKVRTHVKIQD